MTSASMEVAIWRLLEQINKRICPICSAYPGETHRNGCDFWDKLQLMRSIVHDSGEDRE